VPDLVERPGMRVVAVRVFGLRLGLGREFRHRELAPRAVAVAPPQLGAEMAEIECRVDVAVLRQHGRDRLTEEVDVGDLPTARAAGELEQALAGPDMDTIGHGSLL